MLNQSNNKMIVCPKCHATSSAVAQRCRSCGSRFPTYPAETPQSNSAKVSTNTEQVEITKSNSEEPINVDEYLAQLDREFSQ